MTRPLDCKLPSDDGNIYSQEGYTFAEVGPILVAGKGIAEMQETQTKLRKQERGGCALI